MDDTTHRKLKFTRIILAYPVALIMISLAVNVFGFGIQTAEIALPSKGVLLALALSGALLLVTHTWLMTSTELTRLSYDIKATPEEWADSDFGKSDVTAQGWQELQRRHNAHTNTTENVVYFAPLALVFCFISPSDFAAQFWFLAFAIGRFGHTFGYLTGRDGMRGMFMSVGLMALYGIASYVLISLVA